MRPSGPTYKYANMWVASAKCVCVHACVHAYACVHSHAECVHVPVCVEKQMCAEIMSVYMHACVRARAHAYVGANTCLHAWVCANVCVGRNMHRRAKIIIIMISHTRK